MRIKVWAALPIALVLLLGATSNLAYADSSFNKHRFLSVSNFEGHIVFCAPLNPPVRVIDLPGGVQIVTFINFGNIWLTGNPLVDGVEENKVVVTFDPSSPVVTAKIKGKIDVAALDGTWRFRQRLVGDSGFGIGLGSGDLHGKLLLFRTGAIEEVPNSPCGVPFGAPVTGKVISFGRFG